MHDGDFRIGFESLFQCLDRQVKPPTPLVAPSQRQTNMDVLRFILGGLPERGNGVGKPFHRPQGLTAKEEDLGLHAAGVIDPFQSLHSPGRQRVPHIGSTGPAVTIKRNQFQIAFGLPKELLAADSVGVGHRTLHLFKKDSLLNPWKLRPAASCRLYLKSNRRIAKPKLARLEKSSESSRSCQS